MKYELKLPFMKTTVAVCQTHREALNAINKLDEEHYPLEKVSVVGKTEIIEDHLQVKMRYSYENVPLIIGTIAGPVIGIMTGLGAFAIPGLEALFHQGIVIGGLAGLGLGTFIGGMITLLLTARARNKRFLAYQKHLKEGKFLVVVEGTLNEIEKAERILHTEGTHLGFNYG
jgi:hypothetical protein